MAQRAPINDDTVWAVSDSELVRGGVECVARILCRHRRPRNSVSPFRYSRKYKHPSGAWVVLHSHKHSEVVHLAEGFQLCEESERTSYSEVSRNLLFDHSRYVRVGALNMHDMLYPGTVLMGALNMHDMLYPGTVLRMQTTNTPMFYPL